ncbi:MAG: TIGR02452 family protein [Lachnospiraceae bacterium]|nr:TIGR02452 family protein [Lachnospiraceae bacterium]
MSREDNVAVFKDTERLCKTNDRLKEAVRRATTSQKLILQVDEIDEQNKNRYEKQSNVVVSKKRTLEAAQGYKGTKIAVHNFASSSNPGGGVVRGSSAQEECICRCTGLYFSLNTPNMWDGFYNPHRAEHNPIHTDDIIYTSGVTVFKTDSANPTLMPEPDWYDVDVITCAAPNLKKQPSNRYNPGDGGFQVKIKEKELLEVHEKRLRRILEVAISESVETIILGAFGCGAFENNPEIVARAASNVIRDYLYAFKNIEFAVYCSPRDERNFKVFERVLKPYC